MSKPRAVVAMSGGVDSSVAAGLLVEQGYDVVGVTMRLWTEDDPNAARHHKRCCSVEDTDDARDAADVLGVRHYVINLEREFKEDVVDRFVAEYARGRTPNPCLACNDKVKFRPLLEHAIALGAEWLATGHYARVKHAEGHVSNPDSLTWDSSTKFGDQHAPIAPRPWSGRGVRGEGHQLLRAVDPGKDQSYVLYTLGQAELSRTLFPCGEFAKEEIRRLAHEWSLPNADKPDSADICFIPSGDYRAFVRDRIPVTAGDIVDTDGRTVGEHSGIIDYTVGQRRGVPARGNAEPLFVVDIDADTNRVVVGAHEDLMAGALLADELTFIDGAPPTGETRIDARIRYRAPAMPATLTITGDTAEVRFDSRQRAVTPGQAVVFYAGERVIGGGTIVRRLQ